MFHLSRRGFSLAALAGAPFGAASPQPPRKVNRPGRNLLSGGWPPERLARTILARDRWRPFPRARERDGWQELPDSLRAALTTEGEHLLHHAWAPLPATHFLAYPRQGNRTLADDARRGRRNQLRQLVLAECAEYKGRFLDAIVDGIWLTCEETFWGSPAHLGAQKAGIGLPDPEEPVVDLFAADTAAMLAWTDYLVGAELDRVSPLIRRRVWHEVDRRVLAPCERRDDFGWMGFARRPDSRPPNNWNPWINSNWLTASLLLEPDENRRVRSVHKILRTLDIFLDGYSDDGGCDEGPGYWNRAGGSLFDCLELLHSASDGAVDVFADPLIREIGRYIVRAQIHDNWYVNFADASAKVRIDGHLVFRYGRRIGDEPMQLLGAWAAEQAGEGDAGRSDSFGRALPALFSLGQLATAPKKQPLPRDVWLPGIEMMTARLEDGSPRGLYLAAHGGHNAESHNHNDVGDFIVYADGAPAIVDIGVETYTRKTFSSQRYDIWTMQSAWHNLPTIDGVMQADGVRFAARGAVYSASDDAAEFRLDIAPAYPASAGVALWERSLRLDRRQNRVEVKENYSLSKDVSEITLSLVTHARPAHPKKGRIRLRKPEYTSGAVLIEYDPAVFEARTEEVALTDPRLKSSWGDRLYRTLLSARTPPRRATWKLQISQGKDTRDTKEAGA